MTTLKQIVGAANNIKRYEKVHGANKNTADALAHLREAYRLVRANGAK